MHGKRFVADKREVVEYVRMHKQQQQHQQHVATTTQFVCLLSTLSMASNSFDRYNDNDNEFTPYHLYTYDIHQFGCALIECDGKMEKIEWQLGLTLAIFPQNHSSILKSR